MSGRRRTPMRVSPCRPSLRAKSFALPTRTEVANKAPDDEPRRPPTRGRAYPAGHAARGWPRRNPGGAPDFDAKHFLTGAKAAYEMIVTAFAEGDRRTLKGLLSREFFENFDSAITDREQRGETVESRFVAIESATMSAAEMRDKTAQVTIHFVSQLVSVTRAKDGSVVAGSADKVTDVNDIWTFARDVTSRDPNWKLVATEIRTLRTCAPSSSLRSRRGDGPDVCHDPRRASGGAGDERLLAHPQFTNRAGRVVRTRCMGNDDHVASYLAFAKSCDAILKAPRKMRDAKAMLDGPLRCLCRDARHQGNAR